MLLFQLNKAIDRVDTQPTNEQARPRSSFFASLKRFSYIQKPAIAVQNAEKTSMATSRQQPVDAAQTSEQSRIRPIMQTNEQPGVGSSLLSSLKRISRISKPIVTVQDSEKMSRRSSPNDVSKEQ